MNKNTNDQFHSFFSESVSPQQDSFSALTAGPAGLQLLVIPLRLFVSLLYSFDFVSLALAELGKRINILEALENTFNLREDGFCGFNDTGILV